MLLVDTKTQGSKNGFCFFCFENSSLTPSHTYYFIFITQTIFMFLGRVSVDPPFI